MTPKPKLTRHRMLGWFRHIHTQSERRASFVPLDDEPITSHQAAHLIRPARKQLPTAWDDRPVSLWKQRQFSEAYKKNRLQYRPSHFDTLPAAKLPPTAFYFILSNAHHTLLHVL